MKSRKGCLVGMLVVVLLFSLLVMAGSWWLLQQVRGQAGTPTPTIPPASKTPAARVTAGPNPPIVLVNPDMEKLEQAWMNAEAGQLLQVTMSEARLQEELLAAMSSAPTQGYQLEQVQLLPGQVRIVGHAEMNGLRMQIAGTARITAADCWLDVTLQQVQLGRLPAPAFITQQFQDLLRQWSDAYRQDPPMCVSDVTIAPGQITLVGLKR